MGSFDKGVEGPPTGFLRFCRCLWPLGFRLRQFLVLWGEGFCMGCAWVTENNDKTKTHHKS